MYLDILNKTQLSKLEVLKNFTPPFYLAGGTAIALHIGHRQSIDFDLFQFDEIDSFGISRKLIRDKMLVDRTVISTPDELTVQIGEIKWSWVSFPFEVETENREGVELAKLLDLMAMKAYALGRRAKWKDYVDLFFLFRDHFSMDILVKRTKEIFGGGFSEKNFREQLMYFEDVDYTEKVTFLSSREVSDEEICKFLEKIALS